MITNDPPARDSWTQALSAVMNERSAAGQTLVRDYAARISQLGGCWIELNALTQDAPLGWALSEQSRKRLDAWLDGPLASSWSTPNRNLSEKPLAALKNLAETTNMSNRLQKILDQFGSQPPSCVQAPAPAENPV